MSDIAKLEQDILAAVAAAKDEAALRHKLFMQVFGSDAIKADEIQTVVDDHCLYGECEWSERSEVMELSALCDVYDNQNITSFARRLQKMIHLANNAGCLVKVWASRLNGDDYVSLSELCNRRPFHKRRWTSKQDLLNTQRA